MSQFGITMEAFAEAAELDERTLYRYLKEGAPLRDSQAQTMREVLMDFASGADEESQLLLFRELYSFQSPQIREMFASVMDWGERERTLSPEEKKKESARLNRLVLSQLLVKRLVRDNVIAERRNREVQQAMFGILEQAYVEVGSLKIRQITLIRDGELVHNPEGFFHEQ